MKKNAYGLTLAFALLFSAAAGLLLADSAKAELPPNPLPYVPAIQINADGSITPETDLISRNGNTYTLTADVNGCKIQISRSNIVLDGNGHTLTLYAGDNPAIHLLNNASASVGLKNVTTKNIEIFTSYIAIGMYHCSRCHITGVKTSWYIKLAYSDYNTITESTAKIRLRSDDLVSPQSNNNLFFRNNITGLVLTGVKSSVASNIFYKNNMLLDADNLYIFPLPNKHNFWDNGSVGNYWSDYAERYPNASEIGNTGVGDTPYVIDADNIDYHPLMYPYDIENDAITLPTPEPQLSPSTEPQPEPFPTTLVMAASVISVVVVGAGVLVYFRKRKRQQ
jgi:hypothetical protein